MTNDDTDFDSWFGVLQANVLDRTGVDFKDEESVMADYDDGKNVYDVIEDIVAEYGEQD